VQAEQVEPRGQAIVGPTGLATLMVLEEVEGEEQEALAL